MVPNDKNSTIVEDFEILNTIGSGSYGTVRKVLRKRDKKVYIPGLVFVFFNNVLVCATFIFSKYKSCAN